MKRIKIVFEELDPLFYWQRMKTLLLCTLVTLFTLPACHKSVSGICNFGLGQTFKLMDDETEVSATKEVVAGYEKYCLVNDWSIPINRAIKSKQYSIFICFADSSILPSEYALQQSRQSGARVLGTRDTMVNNVRWHALNFQRDSTFICQYWRIAKVPAMQEVFCLLSRDSNLVRDNFITIQPLIQRLN